MAWTQSHKHPCQTCGELVECAGTLERNPDGEPVVVCTSFHLPSGEVDQGFQCTNCLWAELRA